MSIQAQIIADSISKAGHRLTTFQLRYPRFIHAELMTHRVFSRNASSSRAIPVRKMIDDIRQDPAMPVFWGSNKPGMQADDELTGEDLHVVQTHWLNGMNTAIGYAEALIGRGLHKQIANRILEPWAHINVIVTATDWNNFYTLRRDKHAQPEIKALADLMYEVQEASQPTLLGHGHWHLPYIVHNDDLNDVDEVKNLITMNGVLRVVPMPEQINEYLIKISVARCARVSYLTHEGKASTIPEDLALYDRLLGSQPLHASPAEHQATPDRLIRTPFANSSPHWERPNLHGNFTGWCQYRKMLPGEYVSG